MARVAIRKLKHGWCIHQGQEWRVEAPTFRQAASEAMHYGQQYGTELDVAAAIERSEKRQREARRR